MKTSFRTLALAGAAAIALAAGAAKAETGVTSDTVKIGAMGALTGTSAVQVLAFEVLFLGGKPCRAEAPVRGDRERGQSVPVRLRHEQRGAVRRDRHAVGKRQAIVEQRTATINRIRGLP